MAAKREISLNIRLLRKEHIAWRKAAREAGVPLSVWLRARCNASMDLTEARAVLIADEALNNSLETRQGTYRLLNDEERSSWGKLVASAEKRVEEERS